MTVDPASHFAVLYVDDRHETGEGRIKHDRINIKMRNPSDVATPSEIEAAVSDIDAILMDYDLHELSSVESLKDSDQVIDGLELLERIKAVVIRRHSKQATTSFERPLVAIFSNKVDEFKSTVGAISIPAAARMQDVDWIWKKTDLETATDLVTILSARRRLFDTNWQDKHDLVRAQLKPLMGIDEESWADTAMEHLEAMRLPIQALVKKNDAAALLRHLLQVVLAYPGALIDRVHVAQRLRIPVPDLVDILTGEPSSLVDGLAKCRFSGVLSDFADDRYWRAGVDALVWDLTDGRSISSEEGRKRLFEAAGRTWSPIPGPVVPVVDADFQMTEELVDVSGAVQIQPDEWPPQAEPPWISIDTIRHDEELRAMVVPRDRERLHEVLDHA